MFFLMICKSSSNIDHVRSKRRSTGNIEVKSCKHSANFALVFCNFVRMFVLKISRSSLNMGHIRSETKGNLREILLILGSVFCYSSLNIFQNVCLNDFQVKSEYGSYQVRNKVTRPNLVEILLTLWKQHFFITFYPASVRRPSLTIALLTPYRLHFASYLHERLSDYSSSSNLEQV